MKFKLFIALLCVFAGSYLVWGIDIAMGLGLASLGLFSLADILITKRAKRYKLTAIHGTFRADIEGNDLQKVEQDLDHAVRRWQILQQ